MAFRHNPSLPPPVPLKKGDEEGMKIALKKGLILGFRHTLSLKK